MFVRQAKRSSLGSAASLLERIYHATVRQARSGNGNAVVALLLNIMQSMLFLGVFYLMFTVLGARRSAIRGDFVLYLMSGIFLFMTHTKAMKAVYGAEGPTSGMMQHGPMNTMIAITSAALSSLYIQMLSVLVILFVYHALVTPIHIEEPAGAFWMLMLSWAAGVGVGMVLLALKPWSPNFVPIIVTLYSRANMIASGKMFVANTLSYTMLKVFDWNPLFHTIDQSRGFVFINYNPHYSSISYPIYVTIGLITIGMMAEFYTRQHASRSWMR